MKLRERLLALEARALCIIRKWWRPMTCLWLSATMLLHGVILPAARYWRAGEADTDLMALAALVTATAGAFGVREWGKIKRAEFEVEDEIEGL